MTADRSESASRYFDFRLAIGIPLGLMALLLLLDPSGVDFALAELFYEPGQGFIGRHSFWLEDILHDRVALSSCNRPAFINQGRFAGSDVAGKLWKQKSAPKALRVQLLPKEIGSCRRRISFRYEAVSQLWFLSCFPYCSDLGGYP